MAPLKLHAALAVLLFAQLDGPSCQSLLEAEPAPPPKAKDEPVVAEPDPGSVLPVLAQLAFPPYPEGSLHSPLTLAVVQNLRRIAGSHPERDNHSFAKVGDSHTVSRSFLDCLNAPDLDLSERASLAETVAFFAVSSPFERQSLAAGVGWTAQQVLEGNPSPLDAELAATNARYALVLLGTNDVPLGDVSGFASSMAAVADRLTSQGVIPILSSLPNREVDQKENPLVPQYNAHIRATAQARGLPFVDLNWVLTSLPRHGLRKDGIHLTVYLDPAPRPCAFTPAGLRFGQNARNLATLEALDRVRRALGDPTASSTPPGPPTRP